jgi:hypothetical protein
MNSPSNYLQVPSENKLWEDHRSGTPSLEISVTCFKLSKKQAAGATRIPSNSCPLLYKIIQLIIETTN